MSTHATLSSERMDWRTPEWFLDLVRQVGSGVIGLDPCTTEDNPTRALSFICRDAEGGGLAKSWGRLANLAFINPPYGAHLSGPVEPLYDVVKKGVIVGRGRGWAERIAQDTGEWIALVPVRTETDWWKRMFRAASMTLLWSSPVHGTRIRFIDPDTGEEGTQPNAASTVFYHGPDRWKFAEVFETHGTLIEKSEYAR